MKNTASPSLWEPSSYADLIGPARRAAAIIEPKIQRIKQGHGAARFLLSGPPGTGKTMLAEIAALDLANREKLSIERLSGLRVTIDVVKRWIDTLGMGSLFGGHTVRVIHEMDRIPTAAQDLLLEYLDLTKARPGDLAFIGTSNTDLADLQERFQTRLQFFSILGPTAEEIALLLTRWDIPMSSATMLAEGSCGNVRQALLDLESMLDVKLAAAA